MLGTGSGGAQSMQGQLSGECWDTCWLSGHGDEVGDASLFPSAQQAFDGADIPE